MATFFIDLAWPQWNAWVLNQEKEIEEEHRAGDITGSRLAAYMKLASTGSTAVWQYGSMAIDSLFVWSVHSDDSSAD